MAWRATCAYRVLGLGEEELAALLSEALQHSLSLLEACQGGDRELCDIFREALHGVLRPGHVGVAPALPLSDNGEPIEAFYAGSSTGQGGWIVFSPHILLEPLYAAHVLLHELAHAVGLADDDTAEALALYIEGVSGTPGEPGIVAEAAERLQRAGCAIHVEELRPLVPVKLTFFHTTDRSDPRAPHVTGEL